MFISLWLFCKKTKSFPNQYSLLHYETLGGADDCMHGGETLTDRWSSLDVQISNSIWALIVVVVVDAGQNITHCLGSCWRLLVLRYSLLQYTLFDLVGNSASSFQVLHVGYFFIQSGKKNVELEVIICKTNMWIRIIKIENKTEWVKKKL